MDFDLSALDAPTEGKKWLLRAEELAAASSFAAAATAAIHAIPLTAGVDRLSALRVVIASAVQLEDFDAAESALQVRHALLLELDKPLEAACQARAGLALFGRREPYDMAALERETLNSDDLPPRIHAEVNLALAELLAREGSTDLERIHSLAGLAYLLANMVDDEGSLQFLGTRFLAEIALNNRDFAQALQFCDTLLETARHRTAFAQAHTLHAKALSGVGRAVDAAHAADKAIVLYDAIGLPEWLYEATLLAGRLHVDARSYATSLARFRAATALAHELGRDDTVARKALASTLLVVGEHPEAVELLGAIYNHETSNKAPTEERAETLEWLGHSFSETEQPDAAINVWQMAVSLYDQAADFEGSARVQRTIANIHSQRGQFQIACAHLLSAASTVRNTPENVALYVEVMQDLGMAQARAGDRSALTTLDELAAVATQNQTPWYLASALSSQAQALLILGDHAEALAAAQKAAGAFRAANDPRSAALAERFTAEVLTAQGRHKDAVKILRTVLRNVRDDAEMRHGVALELANSYDKLGLTRRATAARSLAENAQPQPAV